MLLSTLQRKLKSIWNGVNSNSGLAGRVNEGGCAYFAVLVAKRFPEHFTGFAVINYAHHDIPKSKLKKKVSMLIKHINSGKITNEMRLWHQNEIRFNHVLPVFTLNDVKYVMDAVYGFMTLAKYEDEYHAWGEANAMLPLEIMEGLINRGKGWNQSFWGVSGLLELLERIVNFDGDHKKVKWECERKIPKRDDYYYYTESLDKLADKLKSKQEIYQLLPVSPTTHPF